MIGWTPQQVDAMSLWEFTAAVSGWIKANAPEEKPEAPSDAEFDAMVINSYGAMR